MNGANIAELIAKVVSLDELIDYQKGAIVSRMLFKKPNGKVVLLAFDEEQELSEQTSPFEVFVYLFEGEIDLTITGKPFHLSGGQIMLLPANQPHSLKARQPSKLIQVMIRD